MQVGILRKSSKSKIGNNVCHSWLTLSRQGIESTENINIIK